MNEIQQFKNELEQIKQRNQRVEADKAWETSWTRKIVLAVLTYLVIVLFFVFAKLPQPFVNSIVPTLGFIVSTASLPLFRRIWLKFTRKLNG